MGFHTILTIAYLIPSLYLFFRIRNLFIPSHLRLRFMILFCLLFLIYPLSNILGVENTGIFTKILNSIAGYLLPFFLYLFLFVLVTDLLLLANLALRIVSFERLRGKSFRLNASLFIAVLSALVVLGGIINFNTIRTSVYHVNVPKKSSGLDHLKIAFISDFHLNEETPVRFVSRAVKMVNEIKPDLMIFGGDIIEGRGEGENIIKFETILRNIKTQYGVFGILGNHEHYANQDSGSFFSRAGITILRDSVVIKDRSFILAGRNDGHFRTRKSLDELMKSVPDSLPVIMADHRPLELFRVGETKADIQFSGHTHNGQLFPINYITKRVYELSWGYKKFGNTHVFVSSGIRLWGPPVRTTGKSEIVVVNVSFN